MPTRSRHPLTLDYQRELLRDLLQAVADRVQAEEQLGGEQTGRLESEDSEYHATCATLEQTREDEKQRVVRQYDLAREEIVSGGEGEIASTQIEYDDRVADLDTQFEADSEAAEQDLEEARWMVQAVLDDGADDSPKHRFETYKTQLKSSRVRRMAEWEELAERVEGAAQRLVEWRQPPTVGDWPAEQPPQEPDACLEYFVECVGGANEGIDGIHRLWLPRLFAGWRPLMAWLLLAAGGAAPAILLEWPVLLGLSTAAETGATIGFGIAAPAVLATLLLGPLFLLARFRGRRLWGRLQQHISDAGRARQHWLKSSKREYGRRQDEFSDWYGVIVEERDNAIHKIEEIQGRRLQEVKRTYEADIIVTHRDYPARLAAVTSARQKKAADCDSERAARLAEIDARYRSDRDQLDSDYNHRTAVDRERFQRTFQDLSRNWLKACQRFQLAAESMVEDCGELFASWERLGDGGYTPPETVPPAIQLGRFSVDLAHVPGGVPTDERLLPQVTEMPMPAILTFPEQVSLLLEADGTGRTAAVAALQTAMLRLLTCLPPGKLRFTIIDPVGLGDNFSAFMHLADFDELLVSGRIWTESGHIDKQLANLTEHMEDVFQTYLRNQFGTIEEYNEYAGEVAEPYHVLVVANFPVNFSDTAVRRLVSIASSGARCGVYTLVSVDSRQQLPHNFDLGDLRQHAGCLAWTGERFTWQDRELAWLSLELEPPPEPGTFVNIVRTVGEYAKDTRRVEVPFERVAPAVGDYWSRDSRRGLDVPLGRAGATKLQDLHLGTGTSQHVLIAGKTGSGKSSFLHTLIVNVGLYYDPSQVEFYLIDFKKGVEFKTYVINRMPHARVVAIESDREFGLSVLERLDGMLKQRGDLFRRHHVQDVAGFRDAVPDEPLPRVLLIIDEFQEFFVEDDRVHQQAALLLDRLVRQGRAFGIHVLLGSQTLGGAYSLARSTMGQVAVRVALQCSEADAHLILSEDNTAARLLTRPGEAIYNDANGLLEGNHPFQIAWLAEDTREERLAQLRSLAVQKGLDQGEMIVFEGNVSADLVACAPLRECLEESPPTTSEASPVAWLGEPVQIKETPLVRFRRQSGSNLLVVGQQAEEALGVLAAAAIALAGQHAAEDGTRFIILDGSASDEQPSCSWDDLAEALPQPVALARPRKAVELLGEVTAEVARRDQQDDESAPPLFVVLYNLGRFRDLRPGDDDFGFGGFDADKPASPSGQLTEILRNGPALGVHVLCWCDTYNNVGRWLTSQTLREFELRIAFQMNASDSSNLIDSATAGRLGEHRALLYLAEQGTLEKFRPFAPPTAEWLKKAAGQLRGQPAPAPAADSPADSPADIEDLEDLDGFTVA